MKKAAAILLLSIFTATGCGTTSPKKNEKKDIHPARISNLVLQKIIRFNVVRVSQTTCFMEGLSLYCSKYATSIDFTRLDNKTAKLKSGNDAIEISVHDTKFLPVTRKLIHFLSRHTHSSATGNFPSTDHLLAHCFAESLDTWSYLVYYSDDTFYKYEGTVGEADEHTANHHSTIEMKANGIMHLTLPYIQYDEIMDLLEKQGQEVTRTKGVILDLRDSTGGLIRDCVETAGLFLHSKDIAGYIEAEREARALHPNNNPMFENIPVVVLVNGKTSSGSELIAAALKEQRDAVIIGSRTHGLGWTQSIIDIADKTCLALASHNIFTPSMKKLHGRGVEPDIHVHNNNTMLKKALSVLERR